jgi:hypothetical protein
MNWNSNDFHIRRAQEKTADAVEILEWVTRHSNDAEVTSLADAEFESSIREACKSLNTFRRILSQHGKPMDLQTEAVQLYNHVIGAKQRLEQVKMAEDTEQCCQRQCEDLEKMLLEVIRKLDLSKRGGRIFDRNIDYVKQP